MDSKEEILKDSLAVLWADRLKSSDAQELTDTYANEVRQQFSAAFRFVWTIQGDSNAFTKDEKQKIVVNTRAALRFGISSAVNAQNADGTAIACDCWVELLADLLCLERGDSKCRLLAARLLSNIMAIWIKNNQVGLASPIRLWNHMGLSPKDCNDRILQTTAVDDRKLSVFQPTWVDAIVYASRSAANRDAVAAVVAALYNCIIAIDKASNSTIDASKRSHSRSITSQHIAEDMSGDNLFVSTLLRQILSSKMVVLTSNFGSNDDEDFADEATEWITLLLAKLCQLHGIESMYSCIGTTEGVSVLPEQLVLLHVMAKHVEESTLHPDTRQFELSHPLGGQAGLDRVLSSHVFLVNLFMDTRDRLASPKQTGNNNMLDKSAMLAILDILASSMGMDHAYSSRLRLQLGSNTELLSAAAMDLGAVVDSVGSKPTKNLNLSAHDQHLLTAMVRLLGNLCFECRRNQNLMRTTPVPIKGHDTAGLVIRTALHVLLSSTSFAYACFTLREWTVMAIRNVLHENEENQRIVAELEAQQAVQSHELQQSGLQVQLDRVNHRVSVTSSPSTSESSPSVTLRPPSSRLTQISEIEASEGEEEEINKD